MADNKPSHQFKLWCVPNIDGKNVLMRKRKSAETKKWYIRLENGINIDSNLLWEQVKYALKLQDNVNIPDIVYCIMSYENEVRTRRRMTTFLELLVQGALQTGALIITSGLHHGITDLLCEVINAKCDGFCLAKRIYLIAIIAESKIEEGWTPWLQTDEDTQKPYVTYSYIEDVNTTAMEKSPFAMYHDLFILVEKGNSTDDHNLTRTSHVALDLVTHLKKTYTDSVYKYVPKGGNEEREFHWYCDGCTNHIIGEGYHCLECSDCDLCYVCAGDSVEWPDGHKKGHKLKKFDTWKTGRCTPNERSKGSWRCTSCGKHIWDWIYDIEPNSYSKEDHEVLCGNCHKWKKDLCRHQRIKLDPAEIRPVSVTWFLLQGGKHELEAACDAIINGIRLLATYDDGGNTAELFAYIYTNVKAKKGSITENQIKCMVNSTFNGACNESDFNVYVKRLAEISKRPENDRIITCGCGCEMFSAGKSASDIIKDGLIKASTDSYQSQLLLLTMWDYEPRQDQVKSILKQQIYRQCISYHDIMKSALVLGRTSFLELFLDYGMPLQPFCNRDTLGHLYRSVLFYNDVTETSPSLTFLRTCCQNILNDEELLSKVANKIKDLTNGIFDPDYGNDYETDKEETDEDAAARVNGSKVSKNDIPPKYEITEKDLYIWAILCGRYEMAKLMWNLAPDHIALALIGSRVLRSLSQSASYYEESNLRDDLEKKGRKFEEFASKAIQECYMNDKNKSHELLVKPIRNLNRKHDFTCLTLAWANHQERFMSKTCCQTKLTQMWITDLRYKKFGFFSPSFQFYFNIWMMAMLLFLLTTFVLTELHDLMGDPSVLEVTVMAWICCLTVEEIRLIYFMDRVGWKRKLKSWFMRQWNALKPVMLILYIASVIARFTVPRDSFTLVHVLYSVTLLIFYLNLLTMGFASNQLGLKLIMIKGMVKELFIFLTILMVFIFGFGVAYEALLHPPSIDSSRSLPLLLSRVMYRSYFQIHGDLLTDSIDGDDLRCVESFDRGCFVEVIIPILTGVYVLITTILLLNLLIAVFSFCITDVHERSEVLWGFYRYGLIKEYKNKTPFFPFGCPFYWIYALLKWLSKLNKRRKQNKGYMPTPKDDNVKGANNAYAFKLEHFEHKIVDAYWRKVRGTKNDLDDTDTIKDVRIWKKNYTANK